jgi:eukaryotic-like serine/threonine-protein kinase
MADEPSLCALLTGMEQGSLLDGKYRIEGVLGVGGMGVVLAATHLDLERPVAIKVLRAELASEERIVTRLLREGRAAASIKNQHVAQVIDVGRLPQGAPYVVMERLEGRGFDRVLVEQGALSLSEAADVIVETCAALAEVHAAGIVHRDLKPANLFQARRSDGSETVKLLDFGISKTLDRRRRRSGALTDPHLALGSPNYMAPEQIKAADDVDARADVWALGTILFELLTARQVFDAGDVNVLQAKILLEEHTPLRALRPDLPVAVDRIVRRCLMKDRNARYPDVEALAGDLAPHGTARALASLASIVRSRAGLRAHETLPPSSDFSAVMPRSRRSGELGRIAGYAGIAATIAFLLGYLGMSLAVPAPDVLMPAFARGASSIAHAARGLEQTEHTPVIAPVLVDSVANEPRAKYPGRSAGYGWRVPLREEFGDGPSAPWAQPPRRVYYGWTPQEP